MCVCVCLSVYNTKLNSLMKFSLDIKALCLANTNLTKLNTRTLIFHMFKQNLSLCFVHLGWKSMEFTIIHRSIAAKKKYNRIHMYYNGHS